MELGATVHADACKGADTALAASADMVSLVMLNRD